jgi:hypothetical protein
LHHTPVGHFTLLDRRASHAQAPLPQCSLPASLTGHIADEVGYHEPHCEGYRSETIGDA